MEPTAFFAGILIPGFLAVGLAALGSSEPGPWTPPQTFIPDEFLQAVKFLRGHGMASPRGGIYRQAKAVGIDPWRPRTPVDVRGWVFPARDGETPQVITLEGLTYPATEVGDPVDIDSDLLTVAPFYWSLNAIHEDLAIATLMLVGDAPRAERLFLCRKADPRDGFAISLLTAFIRVWRTQAVVSHLAGNAERTLEIAVAISRNRSAFEAEVARITTEDPNLRRLNDPLPEFLGYLEEADLLVTDSQRRLARGWKRPSLAEIQRQAPERRIELLIEAMDDLATPQSTFDSPPIFGNDPLVQALVAEGEAALPALFDTLENDLRLTRSAMTRHGTKLEPVRNAALAAVQNILQTYQGAESLKALWLRTEGMDQTQRWLAVLQDSNAGRAKWLDVTRRLFHRGEAEYTSPDGRPYPDAQAPLCAEALRPQFEHELTEILIERIVELSSAPYRYMTDDVRDIEVALEMLRGLAIWAPAEAVPLEARVLGRAYEFTYDTDGYRCLDRLGSPLGAGIGAAVAALDRAGDRLAFPRFVAWVELNENPMACFRKESAEALSPFVFLRGRPDVDAAAERIFRGEGSPWNLTQIARTRLRALEEFTHSPLLKVEAVQRALFDILDDRSLFGHIELDGKSVPRFDVVRPDGKVLGAINIAEGSPMPHRGEKIPFRVCDLLMVTLAYLKGAPRFAASWPDELRDEAILAMKAFLRENANNADAILPWQQYWRFAS